MDIRNLQSTGGKSFSITLPKTWIKKNSLQHKSKIIVDFVNTTSLLLMPYKPNKSFLSVNINADALSKSQLKKILVGYFISGLDSIYIFYKKPTIDNKNYVRRIATKLLGFEVIEKETGKIELKNILQVQELNPSEYVLRLTQTVKSMLRDLGIVLRTKDVYLAEDIIDRDNEVDRLNAFVQRNFIKSIQMQTPNAANMSIADFYSYSIFALRMERIGDHSVRIAQKVLSSKNEKIVLYSQLITRTLKKITNWLNLLEDSINYPNETVLLKILEEVGELENKYFKYKNGINSDELRMIEDSLDRINSYIKNIAEERIIFLHIKEISQSG